MSCGTLTPTTVTMSTQLRHRLSDRELADLAEQIRQEIYRNPSCSRISISSSCGLVVLVDIEATTAAAFLPREVDRCDVCCEHLADPHAPGCPIDDPF